MSSILVTIFSMITIGAIGLLAGGLLLVSVSTIPLFVALPPEQFVFVHKTLDRHMHPYMPSLSGVALVTMLFELWLSRHPWQTVGIIIGIGCIIAIVAISELINVPINHKIAHWTPGLSDEHLQNWKNMWYRGHYLRTIVAVIGLFSLIVTNLII